MAWLHAVPDDKPKDYSKADKVSRFEQFKKTRIAETPEFENYAYVFDLTSRIGMYDQGMNGPKPISWQEISAWCGAHEVDLTPNEMESIKYLSAQYCGQYHKSSNPDELPPAAISPCGEHLDGMYMAEMHDIKAGVKHG